MGRKFCIVFLLFALINLFFGCTSSKAIWVNDFNPYTVKTEDPDNIIFKTIDSLEYHFSDTDFYIENDTLYGHVELDNKQSKDIKIALSDIESIRFEYTNYTPILYGIGCGIGFVLIVIVYMGLMDTLDKIGE